MRRLSLTALGFAALTACDATTAPAPTAPPPPEQITFEFRTRGYGPEETFHARTSSAEVIAQMRAQLALPVGERRSFPIGDIARGDGGHNAPWGWHFSDFQLTEMAIELCDGIPSMIDPTIDYWVDTVGNYCPWGGYAFAELPSAE